MNKGGHGFPMMFIITKHLLGKVRRQQQILLDDKYEEVDNFSQYAKQNDLKGQNSANKRRGC